MPQFWKVRDSGVRRGNEAGSDPRWVRAIPGRVPRSPLELRVQELLLARPVCPWDHLVAEVAQYLRRSERPRALAVLDEAFWGAWVWPALAREELTHLDGVFLAIEPRPSPTDDVLQARPARNVENSPDLSTLMSGESFRGGVWRMTGWLDRG